MCQLCLCAEKSDVTHKHSATGDNRPKKNNESEADEPKPGSRVLGLSLGRSCRSLIDLVSPIRRNGNEGVHLMVASGGDLGLLVSRKVSRELLARSASSCLLAVNSGRPSAEPTKITPGSTTTITMPAPSRPDCLTAEQLATCQRIAQFSVGGDQPELVSLSAKKAIT
ncbi:unnamed protein product [Protopolystoma xenopodis]|uniref:Uncharacterized protein n=1 Tax=Protopolystoma xenopodis TaxID=117903 RepID=A0A448WTD9_9PLAT|nr:unnamed protein product [Protopolystoma xenopodis]